MLNRFSTIEAVIAQRTGFGPPPFRWTPVSGGSINQSFRVETGKRQLFCKINTLERFPGMFENEAQGLTAIRQTNTIGCPEVITTFETDTSQVLLLEWIEQGARTPVFWKTFGEQLAALHEKTNDRFGWSTDNYMGSVPQQNSLSDDWIPFFRDRRLEPLVVQCRDRGLLQPFHTNSFEALYPKLSSVFDPAQKPVLVHGDLWSGNFLCAKDQQPVLIDPAVYYGHPSVDLAMTTLFGGFDALFYEAYRHHRPFPPHHQKQWDVCNLYPLLIHLLLFGRSYLSPIENTLQQFA